MTELTPCPNCETRSKVISLHWSNSSTCEHPEIPPPLRSVLGGIWAVRGTLSSQSQATGRRNFRVLKNDREPIKQLRGVFGVFGNDIRTREKETMDGEPATQYELASIMHPSLCEEYLNNTEPNPLFYKAMTTVAGTEASTYRIVVRKDILDRSRKAFEQVATSIREKGPTGDVDWKGEVYAVYIPLEKYNEWQELDWPFGWWNSKPYYP